MFEIMTLAKDATAADTELSVIRGSVGTVAYAMRARTMLKAIATPIYENEDLTRSLPPPTPVIFWPVKHWWVGLFIGLIFGYLIRLVS